MAKGNFPHIFLNTVPESSSYKPIATGGSGKEPPERSRASHGAKLTADFKAAWKSAEDENSEVASCATRNGVYLEFIGDENFELEALSLEDMRKHIRLLNVRKKKTIKTDDQGELIEVITECATIFVPNKEQKHFLGKLEKYLNEDAPSGKPKNLKLIGSISKLRKALLVESFWCGDNLPVEGGDPEWTEVWLSSHSETVVKDFSELLETLKIERRKGSLKFPERSVIVVFASYAQLQDLSKQSDYIAEYRSAKSLASYWSELPNHEQVGWVDDLLDRIEVEPTAISSVCILDTGVNSGHPLLKPFMSEGDCLAVDDEWGNDDHHRHGTLMAGVAGYGDLAGCLDSSGVISINHSLESVKILPPPPSQNHQDLWGYITSQAISQIEIQNPDRVRTICMAVTSADIDSRGRPSSWSAEVDNLTSGQNDDVKRLVLISAGNITETTNVTEAGNSYPDAQILTSVQDPAQSWNGLTVGAYTELSQIEDSDLNGYSPVAEESCLSPFTTTSATWEENKWPVKPEVVMEGGNLAVDDAGFVTECSDLSILSLNNDPQNTHFSDFNMTSAATARMGHFCGVLQSHYPEYWPETIRALVVHSASWPASLKQQFTDNDSKTSYKRLMEICGYGVPNLDRAIYSASNQLTLIAQSKLQPFDKNPRGKSGYRTKEMHVHELPWPKEALLLLPADAPIEMRVTLSYFVEPGPGEIGWKDRYRYASHGLRFDLNSPGESKYEFLTRINREIKDADAGRTVKTKGPSDHWVIGSQARDRGSIHSDIWRGTAADLASSNMISVSPIVGWWRERQHLNRWMSEARYALIVSIDTPVESADLYTEVSNLISVESTQQVAIET